MKEPSLFRRLFVSILAMLLLLFVAGAFGVLKITSKQIDSDYDAQLIADSHTVWTLVREDLEEGDNLGELHLDFSAPMLNQDDRETLSRYGKWRAVRIWKDDKLAARSENLSVVNTARSPVGFSEQNINDETWRIYTVFIPENKITVEVWENLNNRKRLMVTIGQGILEPGILILPVLIVLLILSIRHGMKALLAMAYQVKARKSDDLSPIKMEVLPKELAPLYRAINTLLERVRQSMAHEREFIDNVAHELKTPLSALRLQGELIANAPTEQQRQECVDDLIKGIDRATHLFDQLLLFSRLSQKSIDAERFSPVLLIQDVISQRANIALNKKIDISLETEKEATVCTNPELLVIMLGALIDNAIKYTPQDGQIHVALGANTLSITDSGPGIPEKDRLRVFERFTRGQTGNIEGCGLGLSIVSEICKQLRVEITLSQPEKGSGLVVFLHFPKR
jgi:two-component system sensor histidine kinase QseC